MVSSPILRLPELQKVFILRTDASNTGIGAVLLQESEGVAFSVAYASKKTTSKGDQIFSYRVRVSCSGMGNQKISNVPIWKKISS